MTPKFKIGDKVRCIEGPSVDVSSGWEMGKEFVIETIAKNPFGKQCYFPKDGCGVYEDSLELITNQMPKKTYTNSQKIRIRLKIYWDKNDTDYDDFEDFYTAFTDALLENLEFIATTLID